jgi:tetratricopeptide (TPR) repeat protein
MIKEISLISLIILNNLCIIYMAKEYSSGYWVDKANELLKESSNKSLDQNDRRQNMLDAVEAYNKALDTDPQMAAALFGKGEALYKLGSLGKAVESYKRYLEMYPKNYTARSMIIQALEAAGRSEEALNQAYKISEADPSSRGWINRFLNLIKLGKFEDALDSFNKSLEIDPQFARALFMDV